MYINAKFNVFMAHNLFFRKYFVLLTCKCKALTGLVYALDYSYTFFEVDH